MTTIHTVNNIQQNTALCNTILWQVYERKRGGERERGNNEESRRADPKGEQPARNKTLKTTRKH